MWCPNRSPLRKKWLFKFYFVSCILEEFGFIASAAHSTELTDFKITETVQCLNFWSSQCSAVFVEPLRKPSSWQPLLVWQLHTCRQGLLEGVRTCSSLQSWWRSAPCPPSSGGRAQSPGQHFLSVPPQSSTQKKTVDFMQCCFGELCHCLPGLHSAPVCDFPWSWQFCTHATNGSLIRNHPSRRENK